MRFVVISSGRHTPGLAPFGEGLGALGRIGSVHFLLIAFFAVAGPGDTPLVAEEAVAAVPSDMLQVGCGHRRCVQGCVDGGRCRPPGGPMGFLGWAPPAYLLPCSGNCGSQPYSCWGEPGYSGFYQPRYDYRRSFDYPWGGRPRVGIGTFCE